MTDRPQDVTIVLVEDDDVDAEAVERAFRKQKIGNRIERFGNGIEALEALRDPNGAVNRPFLILLDLNMPRMSGIEFLHILRNDPKLHDSIVFVLTTSNAERDKVDAYGHHVAGYLLKSNAGGEFVNLVGMLDIYWRYVEFP